MINDLFGSVPLRSISFKQDELIENLLHLHSHNGKIDIDPTYGKGCFYKGNIPKPEHRFDINPRSKGVRAGDCRNLPFPDETFSTIMFDPPFLVKRNVDKSSRILRRYGAYPTVNDLWNFFGDSLKEFYRLLKPNGIVIFKCQDFVEGRVQYFSHVKIMNMALNIGYYPKDLVLYINKIRAYHQKDVINQKHSRKYHTFFWVFEKSKCKIDYK